MGKPQLEMVVDDPARAKADEELAIDEERALRDELWRALRAAVRELGGYDECAAELDKRWGKDVGRPVASSVLNAALHDRERNNFRLEWLLWFAAHSERVADVVLAIAGGRASAKRPEDELEDLKAEIRNQFPRQAENIIRKGKAPRRR